MGAFMVECKLRDVAQSGPEKTIAAVLVDTGSEYTWLPEDVLLAAGVTVAKKDLAFVMANGMTITRDVGYAFLSSGEFETVDEVVFARSDDLSLLGARTLEGFAARVDSREKRLVAAGPIPVAAGLSCRTGAARSGRRRETRRPPSRGPVPASG